MNSIDMGQQWGWTRITLVQNRFLSWTAFEPDRCTSLSFWSKSPVKKGSFGGFSGVRRVQVAFLWNPWRSWTAFL